jgi:hypothetical protein
VTAIPAAVLDLIMTGAMAEARALAVAQARGPVWAPQPGPQTAAYECQADVTGYGGAAGGGKSDLALGLAINQHYRSIIFRREFPRLEALVARSKELLGKDGYNESLHRWELPGGATVRFAQMQYEKDKENYQGRPFDLYVFDEGTEFSESQIRFVTAWNRSTRLGQRCRVVLTFNPPLTESGEWVTRYFAPWLDKTHPHPAADGEIRWYAMVGGKEVERPDGAPFELDGEMITPKSRTFFHAGLADNPILAETGYGDTINGLPEPLRSLLKGNFDAAKIADPWQTIPAEWVRLAQKRWRETPQPEGGPATVGVDPARGGGDRFAISELYRWAEAREEIEEPVKHAWFGEVQTWPGVAVPDGPTGAALLTKYAGTYIGIDVIGIGSSVYDSAVMAGLRASPINNSSGAQGITDKSGRLKFVNVRAASYWKLREALDPASGENVCLPDDSELLSDLCAPRYKVMSSGIQLEAKEDLKERLGRSPDKGDAVVMAWWTALYGTADLVSW